MSNVFDVAAYLLSKAKLEDGDGITHMKLQKLVYYVQGFALVILGRTIFPEKIEAWAHGPVVRELYGAYKCYGNNIIGKAKGGTSENLTDEERELIDDVYNVYGQYSASKLRNLTHSETPWQEAENKADNTITVASMRDFFPSLLE